MSLFKPGSKRTVRRCLKKLGYEYSVKIKETMVEYEASKSSRTVL